MELSGRILAETVLSDVRERMVRLAEKDTIPELAIVTVGGEEAWLSYVSQKLKTAERLGIKTQFTNLNGESEQALLDTIARLNDEKNIHGIIVQRPVPKQFNRKNVIDCIAPLKDIDGFRDDSIYIVPVLLAIQRFIREAYGVITASELQNVLINQSILVAGKGETAGGPAITWLQSINATFNVLDSKTEHSTDLIRNADLIICATGKSTVIKPEYLKKGVILIGVGTHKEDGKLKGDYDVEEIKDIASVWTPTPGGVGPLNLSYLFQNLITATEKQS